MTARAAAASSGGWQDTLTVPARAALVALLLGDVRVIDADRVLAVELAGEPLAAAAARATEARGSKGSPAGAVAASQLERRHYDLLHRVALAPVALAGEAAPVAAVRDAHELNVGVLAGGGWLLVQLVDGHLVYQPRAWGAPAPASPRAALDELVRRDALVQRWSWVPAPAHEAGDFADEVVALDEGALVDLGARVELASDEAARRGAGRVAIVVGELALIDVCPAPAARMARWTARWMAESIGNRAVAGRPPAWADLDLQAGTTSAWHARVLLAKVPSSGPAPAPPIVGPARFDAAWRARAGLALRSDHSIGERQAIGRPRSLSLEVYCAARLSIEAEGLPAGEAAVRRRLVEMGHAASRGAVIRRQREFEHITAELDDEAVSAGIGAVTAVEAVGSSRSPILCPWTGSKRPLIDALDAALPASTEKFCEGMVGSGALFLHLAAAGRVREAVLNDADPDVALLWWWVKHAPRAVLARALCWQGAADEAAYYRARDALNGGELAGVERAGVVLYLIWGAYNGLWRRNRAGGLNAPVGRRRGAVARIELTLDAILRISELLEVATVGCGDAADVIETLGAGWVAYLDPPYWTTETASGASFSGYDGRGFSAGSLVRMVAALRGLAARGGTGLLSNASVAPVLALCEGADVRWVVARRSVSCAGRGQALEVIARWHGGVE